MIKIKITPAQHKIAGWCLSEMLRDYANKNTETEYSLSSIPVLQSQTLYLHEDSPRARDALLDKLENQLDQYMQDHPETSNPKRAARNIVEKIRKSNK